ncbi:MAG TPA: hypothetical protein VFJ97_13235, partial [Dermatophilaceae bacterium]|nr:hypothetical protein [Dermatophilaceae bacterium]
MGSNAAAREPGPLTLPSRLRWASLAGAGLVAVMAFILTRPRSSEAQLVGDVAILLGVLVAVVSCGAAAARGPAEERAAWTGITVGAGVWCLAQATWTTYGIATDHAYPFPSPADLGYIGYSVPVAVGLLLFPRVRGRHSSQLRTALDAVVIAGSILFLSWATVLGLVYQA